MKTPASDMVTERGAAAAKHMAKLIRRARLARKMTQRDLAERARVSVETLIRIEKGEPGVALWSWLNLFEVTGLLKRIQELRDPDTDALLNAQLPKRVDRTAPSSDLDF